MVHFLSVSRVAVVPDEAHNCSVVCILDDTVGEAVVRVNSEGLRTQPWGTPEFREMTPQLFFTR